MVSRPFICLLLPPSQTWANASACARYRVQLGGSGNQSLGPAQTIRLNALAQLPAQLPLYALLHPLDTVIQSVTLPVANSRQQTQAAPWLLEPYLLSDPDSQHVVLSDSFALAVHKTRLEDLLQRLREAERLPVWVGALSLAANAQTQTLAQIWQDESVAVGVVSGQAPIVLPAHNVAHLQAQLPQALLHEVGAWPHLPADPTTWPGNLLQGVYAQQGAKSVWLDSSRWRSNLRWLMALAALWVLALNIDAWGLTQQKKQLQQQLTHAIQKTFPQLPLIVEPRLQTEQQLALLRAQQGGAQADGMAQDEFLPLLEKISGPAVSFSASLRAVHYQTASRTLQLNLNANEFSPARQQTLAAAWQAVGLRTVWGNVVGSDLSVQLSASSMAATAQTGGSQ